MWAGRKVQRMGGRAMREEGDDDDEHDVAVRRARLASMLGVLAVVLASSGGRQQLLPVREMSLSSSSRARRSPLAPTLDHIARHSC